MTWNPLKVAKYWWKYSKLQKRYDSFYDDHKSNTDGWAALEVFLEEDAAPIVETMMEELSDRQFKAIQKTATPKLRENSLYINPLIYIQAGLVYLSIAAEWLSQKIRPPLKYIHGRHHRGPSGDFSDRWDDN